LSKNDEVAYNRNSSYGMNVLVESSHVPFHDFQYMIKGVNPGNEYGTLSQEGHFVYANQDTVQDVMPVAWGHFPDHVGIIDSLNFNWLGNKLMNEFHYYPLNPTGPHKIFLTYDSPKLDTVHTLALDRICRYAEGQNVDSVIAERGVSGAFNEHWDYDPGKLYIYVYCSPLIKCFDM
jgi:hypothetical protein